MMVLVAFLALLMVSTVRFTSLKAVGTGRRDARLMIGLIALVGLIYLYSQWVLLILVSAYLVHGLLLRGITSFTRRGADKQPTKCAKSKFHLPKFGSGPDDRHGSRENARSALKALPYLGLG
jgi:hypothetical protein